MINEDYILKCIEPKLNNKRELSELEFLELFSDLTSKEQYQVIDIMIKNNIDYVDEKEEETLKISHLKDLNNDISGDYKKLMNLTNEQLCVLSQNNSDRIALAALIKKNERFLYKVCIKINSEYRQNCFEVSDLFQYGVIGLIEAVKTFDVSKGYTFLTYSWHKIRQRVVRAILVEGYIIRIPVHMFEKVIRINRYRSQNSQESETTLINRIINNEYLSGRIITKSEIIECIYLAENFLNTMSLNSFVNDDYDEELINFIPNDMEESIEDYVIKNELNEKIKFLLGTLTEREERIIRYRFGIGMKREMTLEEIGTMYNITRERIRQIEKKALQKLAHQSRSKYIESFY